ncbi:hypothetical protein MRX96_024651 [Rhipicephalus microplus]
MFENRVFLLADAIPLLSALHRTGEQPERCVQRRLLGVDICVDGAALTRIPASRRWQRRRASRIGDLYPVAPTARMIDERSPTP